MDENTEFSSLDALLDLIPPTFDEEEIKKSLRKTPDAILPMAIEEDAAMEACKKWLHGLVLAPESVRENAEELKISAIYVPFWVFDARTTTVYIGKRGDENSHVEVKAKGIELCTGTGWVGVEGSVDLDFKELLVPGTKSMSSGVSTELKDWDFSKAVEYDRSLLKEVSNLRHTISQPEAYHKAQKQMGEDIKKLIREDIGGLKQFIVMKDVEYKDEKVRLVMIPFWLGSYKYEGKSYNIAINGQSGEVVGEHPDAQ